MTSGAQTREGQFIEVSWGFHGVLIASSLFLPPRWMILEKVLGVGVVRHWCYLAAKPPRVGVIVDGLACPCTVLRHAAVRRGGRAFCQVVPCLVAVVGGGASQGM
jgi:hypothetical protein